MSRPSPTELQRRIVECVTSGRSVDVRRFELGDPDAIAGALVPAVLETLRCAIQICTEALHVYDPEEVEPDTRGERRNRARRARTSDVFRIEEDALLRRERAERQVADLAFLGVTELRPILQRLEPFPPGIDRWEAVAECSSALRRSANSLTALELALCGVEGLEPEIGFASQLRRSLEVRREYARLRRVIVSKDVMVSEEPTAATLVAAMRSAGTGIAILIGREIYPELRIQDRRQMRELQARMLAWLRVEDRDAGHLREGMRLWQDLVGFAGLIAQVSRRQEIVEHDSLVVERALDALREEADGPVGDEVLAMLETLTGLDLELDALLADHERDVAAWLPVLDRLRAERGPASESSPPFAIATDAGRRAPKHVAR